jgi:GTP-binding protein
VIGVEKQPVHSTEKPRPGADRPVPREFAEAGSLSHPFAGARFLTTAAEWRQLPDGEAPEIAFAGRSNAGKSSAINALAGRTRLAFVSKTPGRTQHINFFELRSGALLADLPGYGYAAVPEAMRRRWQSFLSRYLSTRVPLAGLVLVMDCRRPMTPLDRQMLDWFLPSGRPVRILLAKADKLNVRERALALARTRDALAADYSVHPMRLDVQLFSAEHRIGIAEAEAAIIAWVAPRPRVPKAQKERPRHQGE